jgi:aminoglycoside phosphotransferase (APT) family kinase protein
MPRPDTAVRVRREAATHAALIGAGFPAPRILVAETDPAVLGKPFLIMQRLARRQHVGQRRRPERAASAGSSACRVPLAEAHVLLHGVPGEALRDRDRQVGIDEELVTVAGRDPPVGNAHRAGGLAGLMPGIRWLEANLRRPRSRR